MALSSIDSLHTHSFAWGHALWTGQQSMSALIYDQKMYPILGYFKFSYAVMHERHLNTKQKRGKDATVQTTVLLDYMGNPIKSPQQGMQDTVQKSYRVVVHSVCERC